MTKKNDAFEQKLTELETLVNELEADDILARYHEKGHTDLKTVTRYEVNSIPNIQKITVVCVQI